MQTGTVIHGTYLSEVLIPAFMRELWKLDPVVAREIVEESYPTMFDEDGNYQSDGSDLDIWLFEDLFDLLDDIAAGHGLRFGTLEGDGSDYGFWEIEEG